MSNLNFEEVLSRDGKLVYANVGTSMLPLIREGRDLMIIKKRPTGRLKRYDAVLFKSRGRYVLHRILRVKKDCYTICGDNCKKCERGIKDEQIIGVLSAVVRDGKEVPVTDFKYKLYVHLWCDFFHLRVLTLYLISAVKRIIKILKKQGM